MKKLINKKQFIKLAKKVREGMLTIKPLKNHRGVKLSQTKEGQRELLREYRNKINEVIDWINNYERY